MAKREKSTTSARPPQLLVLGPEAVEAGLLETFGYEFPGRVQVVEIDTDEFTAVCPWSGLPDFGRVAIRYAPVRRILELRSFKFYLLSYRNVGIYQEHALQRMLRDLARVVRPAWMELTLEYKVRGGLHTVCRASVGTPPAARRGR